MNKIPLKAIKIAMMGDSEVGKTSIVNSYCDLEFREETLKTIGTDKYERKFKLNKGNEIKLIIRDTAGQERFHPISLNEARIIQGIIFTFDVTSKKSFENINYWLEKTKEKIITPFIVLFGNKADIDKEKWEVNSEEVKNYAQEMKIAYFEVSAFPLLYKYTSCEVSSFVLFL